MIIQHCNATATKNVPRTCVFCAWSGEIHRRSSYCPHCGKPLLVEGTYSVYAGVRAGAVATINTPDGTVYTISKKNND
jgi:hypothetical protein